MHLFLALISIWRGRWKEIGLLLLFFLTLPSPSALPKTPPGFLLCPSHYTTRSGAPSAVTNLLEFLVLKDPKILSQREKGEYPKDSKKNWRGLGESVKLEKVNSQSGMWQERSGFKRSSSIEESNLEQVWVPLGLWTWVF